MKQFKKYIGKSCSDKNRNKIIEEFSTFNVYFHPENSLLQLDDQPNRLRVFYNDDNDIIDIVKG